MKRIAYAVLSFVLCVSCMQKKEVDDQLFKLLKPGETGITFSNDLVENDSLNYFTYGYIYMGGGVAVGDINNDGLQDIFFTGNQVQNKLYLNKGDLKFEDISEKSGVIGDNRWYTGVTMADVNNDGFLDIYCSVGGKFGPRNNELYLNQGDGTFIESAASLGIDEAGNSVQSTFFDYDKDGDLDLYVANYPPTRFNAIHSYYQFKMKNVSDVESDKLFRNDNGRFIDVTNESGLRSFGLTLSATVGDLNGDSWPDIYVSNDFSTPDYMYINRGDGTFGEYVKEATKQTAFYGMGTDIADFNNDGLLDIMQVDMMAKDNRRQKANMASMNPALFWNTVNSGFHYQYMQNELQLNNGNLINDTIPDFSNVSRIAGVSSTDWSWGPLIVDLDNDGLKDLFVSNGTRREINNQDYFNRIGKSKNPKDSLLQRSLAIPSEKIDNFVYQNKGDLKFEMVNEDWGLSYKGFSNGCVYVDLDNDGDLEIITNNIDDHPAIFENRSSEVNNYLAFDFEGDELNPFGIGVKLELKTDSLMQFQELTLSRGFQSSVAPRMHFGIGKRERVDSVLVEWPDGKRQILTDVNKNQLITLDYQEANDSSDLLAYSISPHKEDDLFDSDPKNEGLIIHKHTENIYDDFEREVLLPHKMSNFGPALEVGDVNGDDLDDVIVGGAQGHAASLYYQKGKGFEKASVEAFEKDKDTEDLDALFFDADGDGDNDLYMVSGGNEFDSNSKQLQDRLYINDGKGNFSRDFEALPEMISSGSKVIPHDFDKDGDLDLFIGGRLVPGSYPFPANSYLLENIGAQGKPGFRDVTLEKAPDLQGLGLVTDALWTDFDQDGDSDLIIVGEWMPVTFIEYNQSKFENVTKKYDPGQTTGWWFSIDEADFDQDGDPDYLLGNLGLNYKYQASAKETFDIYVNDFDKNDKKDIVLSYYNEGEKFPVRGRSCSSQQIPAIKKKFKDYESFSNANLIDVYTEKDLSSSLHYQAQTFASSKLMNNGGSFSLVKLPNQAQISSVNDMIVDDFDGDGIFDVVIAGNLYASEVETPRNDAGIGLFLKGESNGEFTAKTARQTGFYVPGDVKVLKRIRVAKEEFIIAGKNNDFLQFVRIK